MKRVSSVSLAIVLLIASACSAGSGTGEESAGNLSPETVARKAESSFGEFLDTHGGDRKAATERTAAYLKTLPGVKEVRVRGSDSLLVIMADGNELMVLLGRDRL
ncbi:hypothetical protein [Pelobacter propionicus]|uniref:Lipoprotein n=1 Tax=Pelobacter propionicus (strain DSM 2379 / NBRC 103807 / OttBd1) TaxID=338966 RepID=A1AS57_PELPD|nr:hypothetical protein [Pelobacter propionicus]ABL00178.1 hypothetical protein Ppro_2573 [Pelobacter propionicus DSM 2379]